MIITELESILITSIGDRILWRGKKYTVAGRAAAGGLWSESDAQNPDVLSVDGPVLLCLDAEETPFFIPEGEVRILTANPRYVIERVINYLDTRDAINWDQFDDVEIDAVDKE
jgi:hypothetical protein